MTPVAWKKLEFHYKQRVMEKVIVKKLKNFIQYNIVVLKTTPLFSILDIEQLVFDRPDQHGSLDIGNNGICLREIPLKDWRQGIG